MVRQCALSVRTRWAMGIAFLLGLATSVTAQPLPVVDPQLKACQEQLADVRGAVTQIHQPNAAFQAESLVTLNRRLGEAQAREAQQAATIDALQKELDALKPPLVKPGG